MIQPLGPEGVQRRMQEIQSKMQSMFGQSKAADFAVTLHDAEPPALSGAISQSGSGSFAPLQPGGEINVEAPKGRLQMQPLLERAAQSNNVDPALLSALIQTESDFDPNCRSKAGAMGLAQLMPETAKTLGVGNPFDPQQSLNGGAKYLRQMLDKFGNIESALAAYNAGPGAVLKYGGIPPYTETQNYVRKIMGLYRGGKP